MRVRNPGPPDEQSDLFPEPPTEKPPRDAPSPDAQSLDTESWDPESWDPSEPPPPLDEASFSVPTSVTVAKFGLVGLLLVLALAGLITGGRIQFWIGLFAAVAVGVYAARDLFARERLRADGDGVVVVRGYAGHRRLGWSELEQVRADTTTRRSLIPSFAARTDFLEIDAGEEIYLFSRFDLGMNVDEAAATLAAVVRRP